MPVPRKIKPWRGFPSVNAVHGIRARINNVSPNAGYGEFSIGTTTFGATTRRHIGTVPAGAILLPAHRHVEVALAATTTIDVVDSAGTVIYNAVTAGLGANTTGDVQPVQAAASAMPIVDLELSLQTGVILSATGKIDLLVRFYMNKD